MTFLNLNNMCTCSFHAVCSAQRKGLGEARHWNKGPYLALCSLLATKNGNLYIMGYSSDNKQSSAAAQYDLSGSEALICLTA